MLGCNLLSVKTDSKTIGITSSAEFLWCSFCSGQRDKSCSHHFVLNLASQTSVSIEFAPDCSWIVQCLISLSQSSSVRTNPDNVLVLVAVSAFPICGLRHLMKLVPFATRVRMDVKAFSSRPIVSFRSGHRDWSCSHRFVLNVASQTSKLVLMPTSVHLAFSSRPSVPLLITNSKEFDTVYDSNEIH
ncbi:hypothetical protein T07_8894 [Trichinella nelsoni]|uniref:Uncharacterized protein n=1 Tax=Trichinella nelsoni TaxID=6336 RepID=A0A0V0RWV3_9BILA|nr:hypothetical protein T07_8894 [Trichinella nelsoni]